MYISKEAQKAFPSPPTVVDALLCVPRDVRSLPSRRVRRAGHHAAMTVSAGSAVATGLAG